MNRKDIVPRVESYAVGENYQRDTWRLRPAVLLTNEGVWQTLSGGRLRRVEKPGRYAATGYLPALVCSGVTARKLSTGEEEVSQTAMLRAAKAIWAQVELHEEPTLPQGIHLALISTRRVHQTWGSYCQLRAAQLAEARRQEIAKGAAEDEDIAAYAALRELIPAEVLPKEIRYPGRRRGPERLTWSDLLEVAQRYERAVAEQHRSEHV